MELLIILSRILIIGVLGSKILKIGANDSFQIDQLKQQQQFEQQQNRLIQLFQLQCYRPQSPGPGQASGSSIRPITIRQLMSLFNQCARPHLIGTNFIAKDVYPVRFDQMVQQCLSHKLNPEWNICQPFVLESMLYCLVEQDLSMVLKIQLIFRFHREQSFRLARYIMNDCTALLENVWQQQQQQEQQVLQQQQPPESSSSKSWNETRLPESNIDFAEHKMSTI